MGTSGAHQLANFSDEPARYLILSTMIGPEVMQYPDSGYWEGEEPPQRP